MVFCLIITVTAENNEETMLGDCLLILRMLYPVMGCVIQSTEEISSSFTQFLLIVVGWTFLSQKNCQFF